MRTNTPVSAIMTRNLVTAHITDSLRYVSRLLNEHHVRHIPVVSGKSWQAL